MWSKDLPQRLKTVSGAFDITDTAEARFCTHGIRPEQVTAVLDRRWSVIRNRPDRATPLVLIGRDEQGRCLAIPIMPRNDRLKWRPITAWYRTSSEAAGCTEVAGSASVIGRWWQMAGRDLHATL